MGKQTSVLCSNLGSGVQARVTSALEGCARVVTPQLGLNGSMTHGPKLNCAAQVDPQPQPIRTSLISVLRNPPPLNLSWLDFYRPLSC